MLKHIKGIVFSFCCMLFFWFFQYLGALLVLLATGHKFIPFRIFSTINPHIKITDAVANRVGVLTLLGDLFVIIIALLIIKFIMRKNTVKTLRIKKFELKNLKF